MSSLRSIRTSSVKPSAQRTVSCKAIVDRRAAVGSILLPVFLYAPQALALIPDEEDEDMVNKAKANRKTRIAQNKSTTRQLLADDGIVDKQLANDLVPIQKAVTQLAKTGAELEKGELSRAASEMNGLWVSEFELATKNAASESTDAIVSSLKSLKETSSKGDLKAAKTEYVNVIIAFQTWAVDSKLDSRLKGL